MAQGKHWSLALTATALLHAALAWWALAPNVAAPLGGWLDALLPATPSATSSASAMSASLPSASPPPSLSTADRAPLLPGLIGLKVELPAPPARSVSPIRPISPVATPLPAALAPSPPATPPAAQPLAASSAAVGLEPAHAQSASGAPPATPSASPSASPAYYRQIQARLASVAGQLPSNGDASGVAVVRFTVLPSGAVSEVQLARRSGNAALDAAALSLPQRAAPFPPAPGLGLRLEVPLRAQ